MVYYEGTRQAAFRERLLEVLGAMEEQMPEMSVLVELWRPDVVNRVGYADEQEEVWVRLGENIPGFHFETSDRWYEAGVGIIRQNWDWLILPDDLGIKTDDHVIIEGTVYMIKESTEMGGVFKCKIDKQMSRFIRPARTLPVYRQFAVKANIA